MKTAALALVFLVSCVAPVFADLEEIVVRRPDPIPGEIVIVSVVGTLPDLCWSLVPSDPYIMEGHELLIHVNTHDQRIDDSEATGCGTEPTPYRISIGWQLDDAGLYVIRAIEHAQTLDGSRTSELTYVFMVEPAVGAEASSWAAVKCLFR